METKVIDINSYKSSVKNSPLLSGDAVEVKAYTASFNTSGNSFAEKNSSTPPTPPKVEQVQNHTYTPPPSYEQYESSEYTGPEDDNIDSASFGDNQPEPAKEEEEPKGQGRMAEQSAMMMIGMYSMMVPPIIANICKSDVGRFRTILDANSHVPKPEIDKLEKFLITQNREIEEALKLTKEQVILLKQALAAVLAKYNLEPANPLIQLLIVVIGIAVSQFMAIREIINNQNEQLTLFIKQFAVRIPEGMEITKRKLFVRKREVREAA